MIAVPLLNCLSVSSFSIGKSKYITKFVECPVVLSSPFLSGVLYTGHLNKPVEIFLLLSIGMIQIKGSS